MRNFLFSFAILSLFSIEPALSQNVDPFNAFLSHSLPSQQELPLFPKTQTVSVTVTSPTSTIPTYIPPLVTYPSFPATIFPPATTQNAATANPSPIPNYPYWQLASQYPGYGSLSNPAGGTFNNLNPTTPAAPTAPALPPFNTVTAATCPTCASVNFPDWLSLIAYATKVGFPGVLSQFTGNCVASYVYQPVCGTDARTYLNSNQAACYGVTVFKWGFC